MGQRRIGGWGGGGVIIEKGQGPLIWNNTMKKKESRHQTFPSYYPNLP